jgi:hypothetical protein
VETYDGNTDESLEGDPADETDELGDAAGKKGLSGIKVEPAE